MSVFSNKKLITITAFIAAIGTTLFIFRGSLERLIHQRTNRFLIQKLQPLIPLKIRDFDLDLGLNDLLKGGLGKFRVVFEKERGSEIWLIELRGSVAITLEEKWLRAHMPAELRIGKINNLSEPLAFEINGIVSQDFSAVQSAQLSLTHQTWKQKDLGVEVDDANLYIDFDSARPTPIKVKTFFGNLTGNFKSASQDILLSAEKLELEGELEKKSDTDGVIYANLQMNSLETLDGDRYHKYPLQGAKTALTIPLSKKKEKDIEVGTLSAVGEIELRHLATVLAGQEIVLPFKVEKGSIRYNLKKSPQAFHATVSVLEARMRAENRSWMWDLPLINLGIKKIGEKWDLNFSIAPQKFKIKKFILDLEKISDHASFELGKKFSLHPLIKGQIRTARENILPLHFPLAMELLPDVADFQWMRKITVPFMLDPIQLEEIAKGLCIKNGVLPSGQISVQWKNLHITPAMVRTDGSLRLEIFQGVFELDQFKAFDIFSDVPEVQFSSKWNGFELAGLGKWLGFGEMQGQFVGHFKDVVFQSWLPTQYDFYGEVLPRSGRQVVFSPEAMQNTVQLFAGQNFENSLPGFAEWMAFGLPSRILGGYNVQYAGLKLFSADGVILLETLDPKNVYLTEENHFILYGPRFKIPLRGERYPVVMDAHGMGNLARHMFLYLKNLKEMSQQKDAQGEPENENCMPE